MKLYMDFDEDPVIPSLIEEVPDFKEFVKPYINNDTLIGHTKGRKRQPLNAIQTSMHR
jgi:hypothetical protein